MCSRQTHSRRQISLTPWYPGAQSILIKKRFWLLLGSESPTSFRDICPQREAAGGVSEVPLSSGASPPSFLPAPTPPRNSPSGPRRPSREQKGGLFSVTLAATTRLPQAGEPRSSPLAPLAQVPAAAWSSLYLPTPPHPCHMWGADSSFQH